MVVSASISCGTRRFPCAHDDIRFYFRYLPCHRQYADALPVVMIVGRLRDKDGNITRENIDGFKELVDKIEKNDKQKKDKEGNS